MFFPVTSERKGEAALNKGLLTVALVGGLVILAFILDWAMTPLFVGLVGGGAIALLFLSVPPPHDQEELESPLEVSRGEEDLLGMAEELGFAAKQLLWNANESVSAAQNLVGLATDVALNSAENASSLEECTAGWRSS